MQDLARDLPAHSSTQAPVTAVLAEWVARFEPAHVSEAAMTSATHALIDWCGVTLAAHADEAVRIVADALLDPDPSGSGTLTGTLTGPATLVGRRQRARILDAALINGTAGHALDYDDVNPLMGGHASVVVMPVALALAERERRSGAQTLAAIVAGFEVGCALGAMTRQSHYEKGFHNTATIGTFAAAATAAKLLSLDARATAIAFGLAASQAAGLKCNFGTMTKPLHAGLAAQGGLRAAILASRGFTANPEAIEASQGFAATQAPLFDPTAWTSPLASLTALDTPHFGVEATRFKYHAACYGAQAAIEAAHKIRREHAPAMSRIAAIDVEVPTRARGQCDQPEPETGLTMKFSVQHMVATALAGRDTSALETYSAAVATDPGLVEVRRKVSLHFEADRDRYVADVKVTLTDGTVLRARGQVGEAAPVPEAETAKVVAKFRALAEPVIGGERMCEAERQATELWSAPTVDALMAAIS